ncbi:Uncharacterised protein [Mycobacteroides abscessus subsp. abscessus]|uniref:DUF7302 family protein n=1 Tax=Mycobacteroides abscessus TaxID=36809 RepID=UPI000928BE99|nr:hypothetical protein [Mycobacteroides abscessus]SHS98096.1 Uncharacterised protein [Mycobacteroides abscessus subsp. abscessus]SLK64966.1 Uncharacterised protein [Mycobacteroides abscessus subsp. abscessus]
MLVRHKINGVVAVVGDELGERLIASGEFVKPRKRAAKTEQESQPEDDVIAWLAAEEAFLNSQGT